jgi:hypothetical protein
MTACEGCGGEHTQEEFDSLTGGPSEHVMRTAVDTFRALTTLRVGQITEQDEDVDGERLMAATAPIQNIATVIMFLRHSVKSGQKDGDLAFAEEMAEMLFAVEVVTAVATMGTMLFADHLMHDYEREFTPQSRFAERWSREMPQHIPPYSHE